jgi:hypothetical protein
MLCTRIHIASASSWSDGRLRIDGHRLRLIHVLEPQQCDIDPTSGIGGDERHALHSHLHAAGVTAGCASLAIGCDSSTCSIISTPEQCDIDPTTGIGGDERHALHSHLHRAGVIAGYASMAIGCDSSTCLSRSSVTSIQLPASAATRGMLYIRICMQRE